MVPPTRHFTREQLVAAPAERVWAALVDWPRHGAWVPATQVRRLSPAPGSTAGTASGSTGGASGVGDRFAGRTRLLPGTPLAFDDVMEVSLWQPPQGGRPGRCEVVKQGRVVGGRAVFEVHPLGPDRTRVLWTYHDLTVDPTAGHGPDLLRRLLGALVGRPAAALTEVGLGRVLAAMAADVEADRP